MLKKMLLLTLILTPITALGQTTAAIMNYCQTGALQASVTNISSTNFQQGIIPFCTVQVYLTGTFTPAVIYADSASDPLTNPFKANSKGIFTFWAAAGQGYDIVLSGGVYPNTYQSAFTLLNVYAGSSGGIGCAGNNVIASGCTSATTSQGAATAIINGNVIAPSSMTAGATNGALNANTFPGGDTGAQINNAFASIPPDPTSGQQFGTVILSPAQEIYNVSTTINVPNGVIFDCQHAWLNWVGAGINTSTWGAGTPVAMFTLGNAYTSQPNSELAQGQVRNCNIEVNGTVASGPVSNNVRAFFFGGDPSNVIAPTVNFGAQWTISNDWVLGFYKGVEGGNNFFLDTFLGDFFADNYNAISDDICGVNSGEMFRITGGQIFNSVSNGFVSNCGHQWNLETSVDYSNTLGAAGVCNNAEVTGRNINIVADSLYLEHYAGPVICTQQYANINRAGGGSEVRQRGTPMTIQGYSIDSSTPSNVTFTTNFQNAPPVRVGDNVLVSGLTSTQGLNMNGKVFTVSVVPPTGITTSTFVASNASFTGSNTGFISDAGSALEGIVNITNCTIAVSGGVATATFIGVNAYNRSFQFVPSTLSNCSVLNGNTLTVEAANLSGTSWQSDVTAITTTPVSGSSDVGISSPPTMTGWTFMYSTGGGIYQIEDSFTEIGVTYASQLPMTGVVDFTNDVNANVAIGNGGSLTTPVPAQVNGYYSNGFVTGNQLNILGSGGLPSVISGPLFTINQTLNPASGVAQTVNGVNAVANADLQWNETATTGGIFLKAYESGLANGSDLVLFHVGQGGGPNNSAQYGMHYTSTGDAFNYAFFGMLTSTGKASDLQIDAAGDTAIPGHFNQVTSLNTAGTCQMSSSTSCTFTLNAGFNTTPICIATVQGVTPISGACSASGPTITITAASSNSLVWGAMLIGSPN